MLRGLAVAVALLLAAAAAAFYLFEDRSSLDAYAARTAARWEGQPGVTATFLGVSTLLISDGETHLMTDGFFSRPGLWDVALGDLTPDGDRITDGLTNAGIQHLDAVVVLHSHYDHAMDAPDVADRTGALLVGSESTANVARGWGLPSSQMVVAESGVPLSFGKFSVTLVESRHLPHGVAEGTIDEPLVPPARAVDYKQGKTYVAHIDHPLGTVTVVGSAGFVEDALAPFRSDVVLLGVGGLSKMDDEYRETYYREVLDRLHPQRVFPIHYDDFSRPLTEPLRLFPRIMDDFDQTMTELSERSENDGYQLELLRIGEPVLLLDGE